MDMNNKETLDLSKITMGIPEKLQKAIAEAPVKDGVAEVPYLTLWSLYNVIHEKYLMNDARTALEEYFEDSVSEPAYRNGEKITLDEITEDDLKRMVRIFENKRDNNCPENVTWNDTVECFLGKERNIRDCLSCGNSASEPSENEGEPDILHCMIKGGYPIVEETDCCEEYNGYN